MNGFFAARPFFVHARFGRAQGVLIVPTASCVTMVYVSYRPTERNRHTRRGWATLLSVGFYTVPPILYVVLDGVYAEQY